MVKSIPEAFDDGSAEFAEWTPLLWDPIGAAAVDTAPPRPGDRVLDVCCGAGSSAIPAARAVGPGGLVDAVDLARALLDQGMRRAEGLPQLRFHHADATRWTPADGLPYDRVQCVFGVFFLPDMDAAVARLVGLLRPGGAVGVTTWRQGSVDDVVGPLVQALTEHTGTPSSRPPSVEQAARVDTDEKLAGWLGGLGLDDVAVRPVELDVPVTPDSAWRFVMGSALRSAVAGLDASAVSAIRDRYRELMASTTVLRARALVGTGVRPG
ncbi:class I SAM-dependent methyltransferase [Saccharothrix saharensis]|uniref:class I SAM-dependent methyltransferase n=1 Tax=Saccharothrix saharensis TaxID=571190 RepID=UPI0036927640